MKRLGKNKVKSNFFSSSCLFQCTLPKIVNQKKIYDHQSTKQKSVAKS